MRVVRRVDQLHIDPHLFAGLLYSAFQNICDTQLLRDFPQVIRRALVFLGGCARDDFQVGYFG